MIRFSKFIFVSKEMNHIIKASMLSLRNQISSFVEKVWLDAIRWASVAIAQTSVAEHLFALVFEIYVQDRVIFETHETCIHLTCDLAVLKLLERVLLRRVEDHKVNREEDWCHHCEHNAMYDAESSAR